MYGRLLTANEMCVFFVFFFVCVFLFVCFSFFNRNFCWYNMLIHVVSMIKENRLVVVVVVVVEK